MKNAVKKGLFIFLIFSLFIRIDLNFGFLKVEAEPIENVNDFTIEGDIVDNTILLGLDENTEKTITLTDNDKYVLNNCTTSTEIALTSISDNSCTIKSSGYGIAILNLEISNTETNEILNKYYHVNVEADKYMDILIDKIPNYIDNPLAYSNFYSYISKFLPQNVFANRDYNCEKTQDSYICLVTIIYNYSELPVNGNYSSLEITRSKNVTFKRPKLMTYTNIIDLDKDKTYSIYLNDFIGDYNNIIWVSENNNIATVDQTGLVKGISKGKTKVKVYDKTTMESVSVEVNVREDTLDNIDSFINLFNGNIEIDISKNNGYYPDENEFINYAVSDYFRNLFEQKMNKDFYLYSITNYNNLCNDNKCKIEFSYGKNGNTYNKATQEFTVDLKGIRIKSYNSIYLGQEYTLSYETKGIDSDEIIINYDPLYLEKQENGNYIPLKVGKTKVELISSSGYTASIELVIQYNYDENTIFNNYLASIKTINLPYSENNFNNINDYIYLENIIKEKIINEYPKEETKKYLEAKVTCFSSDRCSIKLDAKIDYQSIISYYNSINSKITYDNTELNTIDELKKLVSSIKDNYTINLNDTITLENICLGNMDCFYSKLIEKSELNDIISNAQLDIELEKNNTFDFVDSIKGGVNYKLKIKKDSTVLYTKDITIISNHIISMSSDLDDSVDSRISYVKKYIDRTLNGDCLVSLLRDNIYQINNDTNIFNIVLDQKNRIKITSINVENRLIELKTGDSEKILFTVYPIGANTGNISYKSDNDNIASVDKDGNIIAKSKGYTFITVSTNSYSSTKILVIVDMKAEEVLNEYLNDVSSDITITYSDIRNNNGIEQAISNVVSQDFYNGNSRVPFSAKTVNDNGKYYIKIEYYYSNNYSNVIESKLKEINYQIKGISFEKNIYDLKVGETVNTKLFFSEGDNNNLYFDYSELGIASITNKGDVTALKPGVVYIYVNDKYNQYYNYIKVRVNYESYYQKLITDLKEKPIEINYNEYGNSIYELGSTFHNKLSQYLDIFESGLVYDTQCDEVNSTCTIKSYESTNPKNIYMNETFPIKLVGIKLFDKEISLDIDETYKIKYEVFDDNPSSVVITTLNPDICSVTSGNIIGISAGVCTIKYKTSNYVNYQHVIVDEEGYWDKYNDLLNSLPSTIELPMEQYDYELAQNSYSYMDMYYFTIIQTIKKVLNSNLNYEVHFNLSELENGNSMNISLSPFSVFNDNKNNYYYSKFFENTDEKKISFTYKGIPSNLSDIGLKINQNIKEKYELSLQQYLKYRLDSSERWFTLVDYSNFKSDLEKNCPECTYIMMGGGGMMSATHIEEGGDYLIFYNEYPITTVSTSAMVNFEVIQMGEILSEEDYIKLIIEEIKEAYKQAKSEISIPQIMPMSYSNRTSNVRRLANNDDIEVIVEKHFDKNIMKNVYTFTVEDISFTTAINTKVVGDIKYTYSVTGLKVDKTNITLEKGNQDTINIEILPSNATNKNVTWISNNPDIVSVDSNGKITALKAGNATVTVITTDGNFEKQIAVKVTDNSNVDENKPSDNDNNNSDNNDDTSDNNEPEISTNILGDVNEDKVVNMADLIQLRKYVAGIYDLSTNGLKNADINVDGKVNITDIIKLRKYLAGLEKF